MRGKITKIFVAIIIIIISAVAGIITVGAGADQGTILDRQPNGEVPSNITISSADRIQSNNNKLATYTVVADKKSNINNTELEQFGEIKTTSGRLIELQANPKHQEDISEISWIVNVREANQPVRSDVEGSGSISSLGVEGLHQRGVTGKGIKIGIIDFGFDAGAPGIRNNIAGERRFSQPSGPDHGTAVAQVVTKTAPSSSLYLATARTTTDVAASLDYFSEEGVDIVVMSVSYPTLNDDGDHVLTQPIADARADGILYINSAGNYRNKHWEGPFTDSDDDSFHEFNNNVDERNCIPSCQKLAVSGQFRATLDWKREGDGSEYRIGLYDPTTQEVFASSYERFDSASHNRQWINTQIGERPVDLIIQNTEGPPNDDLELYVYDRPLERSVGISSVAPPGDTSESISVAAYARSQDRTTTYSSMGPTDVGRTEPTVTGYTNIEVPRYQGVFAGTSSAAPYVAGVAALVEDASSEDQTPADLSKALTSTADDIAYTGFDTVSGAGVVNATKVVQESVSLPPEADAGPDQNVTGQETITLDGTNSSDPDSETLKINWKQTAGPQTSLSGGGTLRPNFKAPSVTQPTTVQFELTVTDGSGNSDSDRVNISILPQSENNNQVTLRVDPPSTTIQPSETTTVDILITGAANGVGSYGFDAIISGNSAKIVGVDLIGASRDDALTSVDMSDDGSELSVTTGSVGEINKKIATIKLEARNNGTSIIVLNNKSIVVGDNAANSYTVTSTYNGTINVEQAGAVEVIGNQPATDINGDGKLEDVNGDGTFNIVDVSALFKNRNDAAVQNNPDKFDFNGDGTVNIIDVSYLFNTS